MTEWLFDVISRLFGTALLLLGAKNSSKWWPVGHIIFMALNQVLLVWKRGKTVGIFMLIWLQHQLQQIIHYSYLLWPTYIFCIFVGMFVLIFGWALSLPFTKVRINHRLNKLKLLIIALGARSVDDSSSTIVLLLCLFDSTTIRIQFVITSLP